LLITFEIFWINISCNKCDERQKKLNPVFGSQNLKSVFFLKNYFLLMVKS
jgi:hypothetical protein